MSENPVTIVACSVLKGELLALCREQWPEVSVRFMDSMLHMYPEKLACNLEPVVAGELAQGRRVLLVYGDCCARMAAMTAQPHVIRVPGCNCCELLLGRAEYRRLLREGAFFLMPEWAHRWREVFTVELGLNPENAVSFMRDMHRRLVYLDTGLEPAPVSALAGCSAYCGLPYEILPVPLDTMRATVADAIRVLQNQGAPS